MQEFPFQRFIKLIAFDQELLSLEKIIDQELQSIKNLEEQIAELQLAENQLKKERDEAQKAVHAQELHMKELDAAQKAAESRLDTAVDHKAYQALKHEIASLRQKQHDFEDELVQAWNVLENATKNYDQKKDESVESIDSFNQQIQDSRTKLKEHEVALAEKQKEREEKAQDIPEEWLEKYAMMRRQVSNPVVPVINGACSGCFYQVNGPDLARLRNNALLQCRDCYRFLYMEKPR